MKNAFSDIHKLSLWQKTELAVIEAGVKLGMVPQAAFIQIRDIWAGTPIDVDWWLARDTEIHHDLNAFVDERVRHVPVEQQQYVHAFGITSFDTQEAAFATMLKECLALVETYYAKLCATIRDLAIKYRYTIMNHRTHGQEAELSTFGARCLTWYRDLETAMTTLRFAAQLLRFSKLSGAIGKYGHIDPEMERIALGILGFAPYYGATQIMPRIVYAPVADALCGLVAVINKIALDIRLAARSGRPLMREPFSKRQKGSSAMPHKKNPIRVEQLEGMLRMATGYASMIKANIVTWEERAIDQSSVERVAWPDLFHVTLHSLSVLKFVLSGLKVYPANMLREIHESRGVYASPAAKDFLKRHLADLGHEAAYRIVQLACFNVFEPSREWMGLNDLGPRNFGDARWVLERAATLIDTVVSIRDFIPSAQLRVTDELEASAEQVAAYNERLSRLFADPDVKAEWTKLFDPAFLLKNEGRLYKEILGVE